jgi:hypothetical protein
MARAVFKRGARHYASNTLRLTLFACILINSAAIAHAVMDSHVYVLTVDPNHGNSDALETVSPWTVSHNVEQVSRNAFARHFYGLHYVVNRSEGTIQVIDAERFKTDHTFSVGASSPHDILVVAPDRAYVSRYDSALLYEIDPTTGALRDTIDLSPLADEDGLPEMSMMALDGNHLFVQLQRIDRGGTLLPVPPSYLGVIDIRTNQLIDVDPLSEGVQGVALTGLLPSFRMHVDSISRRLVVCTPAQRLDTTGGIEEVDLDRLQSLGFLFSEARVGVDLGGFVMTGPDRAFVIAHTDIVASSHLTVLDRDPGAPGQGEIYTSLSVHNDQLAYDAAGNHVFYPDAAASPPGIHVFDTLTNARLTDTPVATAKPPVDLLVAREGTPGEAGGLVVTGFDAVSGDFSLAYLQACGATNHNIVFGPLQEVAGYGYSGQVCNIGSSGSLSAFNPGPGSFFFLVVGTDGGGREGSYGLASGDIERPEDLLDPACSFTQDLTARCDP